MRRLKLENEIAFVLLCLTKIHSIEEFECKNGKIIFASNILTDGSGDEEHGVRSSSSEYYTVAGSKRRKRSLQMEKLDRGISRIEAGIPTPKIASIEQYSYS